MARDALHSPPGDALDPMPAGSVPPAETAQAGAVAAVPARRLRGTQVVEEQDSLVVEAPLEIRIGEISTVLLRTPGNDDELVRGFLFSEGLVRANAEIGGIERLRLAPPLAGNVVSVTLDGPPRRRLGQRLLDASAACGACGKASIAELQVDAPVVASAFQAPARLLASLPQLLRAEQTVFAATGGLHAAGLFDAEGGLRVAREDIGRHNAVDKALGWTLEQTQPDFAHTILVVSGRLGYEIVQKAIVAGIPIVVSVGAASTLAVELAQGHGLALVTFARPGSLNVFGRTGRVTGRLEP